MIKHKTSNLLLFLFFAIAALTTLLLSPNDLLQAAPVFQSGLPTPTFTPTNTSTPTPTPTLPPPDLSLSNKTVSHSVATLGDVLTYTVTIINTGGPAPGMVMLDNLKPEMTAVSHLTYTDPVYLWVYLPDVHAIAGAVDLPAGPVTVTMSWQVTINQLPADGILTNTVGFWWPPQLIYREAVTILHTPTPTGTSIPTATAFPTYTPLPTATPTATASPTNTPLPTIAPNRLQTLTPTVRPTGTSLWTPPPDWPIMLPETGE